MKSKMPIMLAIAAFLIIASVDASQRPVFAQCETVTDEAIVKEIYSKLSAEKKIAPQLTHINVVSVNRVVKLQGWTDTKDDYALVMKIVSSVKCVVMINTQLFDEVPPPANSPLKPGDGGCGPGFRLCGDICIPDTDKCNITFTEAKSQ
jgi:formate hydrogenlyase subunit 4